MNVKRMLATQERQFEKLVAKSKLSTSDFHLVMSAYHSATSKALTEEIRYNEALTQNPLKLQFKLQEADQ